MKYYIDYQTGAGNFEIDGDLSDAKCAADKHAAYTQQDILIYDENDILVAKRVWYGSGEALCDEENILVFGNSFYDEWQDV